VTPIVTPQRLSCHRNDEGVECEFNLGSQQLLKPIESICVAKLFNRATSAPTTVHDAVADLDLQTDMNRRRFIFAGLLGISTLTLRARRLVFATSDRRTVLLVDDEPCIRRLMRLVLEQVGRWEVVEACNSEEALEISSNVKLELVISDIARPGTMDGFDFLKRFKALHPVIPVIIASGNSSHENLLRALSGGAYAFLPKPFTIQELLTVSEASQRRRFRLSKLLLNMPGARFDEAGLLVSEWT
jgi:CheY-like chemotaxis protein